MNWENSTKYLEHYPKTKLEEGLGDTFGGHRLVSKRRTSHQSTEHELEVCVCICLYVNLKCTVTDTFTKCIICLLWNVQTWFKLKLKLKVKFDFSFKFNKSWVEIKLKFKLSSG